MDPPLNPMPLIKTEKLPPRASLDSFQISTGTKYQTQAVSAYQCALDSSNKNIQDGEQSMYIVQSNSIPSLIILPGKTYSGASHVPK